MPADHIAMSIQLGHQLRPRGEPHRHCDTLLIDICRHQNLRLLVGQPLQFVFEAAQIFIRIAQLVYGLGGQIFAVFQHDHRFVKRGLLKTQIASAVHQLQRLHDELDFANATRPELDVLPQAFAAHLFVDLHLHAAQRFEGREIQIAAIHERTQTLEQFLARNLIACDDARLDERVTLPVAPLTLIIIFHGVEAAHQRTFAAIGTQPHVDAEHEAVAGHRVDYIDEALPESHEELLIDEGIAIAAERLTRFGIGKDEIDVRRQIQLMRAELAHADHDEALRNLFGSASPGRADGLPPFGSAPLMQNVQAEIERGISQS